MTHVAFRSLWSGRAACATVVCVAALRAVPVHGMDLQEIEKRGALRVLAVLDRERHEFFAHPPGKEPGFDRELIDGFCRLKGLRLEVVPQADSDKLVESLLARRGDVIVGRFRVSEERLRIMAFTSEVFPSRLVVLTRRPHPVVRRLTELRQEKVGTMKGTTMVEALQEVGIPSETVEQLAVGTLPEALRSGRITAAVWGLETAMAMQRDDPAVQLGMFLGPPGSIAWAVRKEDTALLQALNAHLESAHRFQIWSRLVVRYFGEAAPEILRRARAEER